MRQASEQVLQDKIDYSQQEDHNRYLVDPVHHFNVDVRRARRILLAEKVSANLAKGKELLPSPSFSCIICLWCFHNYSAKWRFRLDPVAIAPDDLDQFVNSVHRRNVSLHNLLAAVKGNPSRP